MSYDWGEADWPEVIEKGELVMHQVNTSPSIASVASDDPQARTLPRQKLAELVKIVNEWMADESGYDEQTWPELKAALQANRGDQRKPFGDQAPRA